MLHLGNNTVCIIDPFIIRIENFLLYENNTKWCLVTVSCWYRKIEKGVNFWPLFTARKCKSVWASGGFAPWTRSGAYSAPQTPSCVQYNFLRLATALQTLFLSQKLRIHSYEFVKVFSIFCCEWPVVYVSLYGDEWKNRSPGIYYLKSLEILVNSKLQIYPMEFYSVRKGLELWRLTNQILSHKASFGPFPLMPHSSYPKRPPSKIDFLKRNQTKS